MGTLQVGGTTLGVKNTSTNKVDLSNVGDVTLSAGTIGTGVTINAGTNVSGIGQLIGVSHSTSVGSGNAVTVESSKNYVGFFTGFNNTGTYSNPPEVYRFTVNSSGTVSQTIIQDWDTSLVCNFGTNTITAHSSATYSYLVLMIFEEGAFFDYT